jgi:hypothetical protein
VPSKQANHNVSTALAAVDNVGALPPSHFTAAGHVTVLDPVPSCTSRNENDFPAPALGNVNVQFAVRVTSCIVYSSTSGSVCAEPEALTVLTFSIGE